MTAELEILRGAEQFQAENYPKPAPQADRLELMILEAALRADYQRQISQQ